MLVRGVLESIAGVEAAEIIYILDVPLKEIKTYMESLCKEVQSVECFGLGLGDGRDVRRSRRAW